MATQLPVITRPYLINKEFLFLLESNTKRGVSKRGSQWCIQGHGELEDTKKCIYHTQKQDSQHRAKELQAINHSQSNQHFPKISAILSDFI